jgi:hypothetical protein
MTGCYLDQRQTELNHYDLPIGRRLFSDCPFNLTQVLLL